MEHESQSQSESENDCYSTNQEYFLDLCRFGEFDQIKDFLSTLNQSTTFDWEWTSNSGDNFVRNYLLSIKDMLAGNNFPEIFVFLMKELEARQLKQKISALINKKNSTGNTPLHYCVITESKEMLIKLLEQGADPSIVNEFERTPLEEAEMIQKFQIAQILAPVTKADIEKLKKEFGAMDVCNEDSSDEEEEDKAKEEVEKKQKKKE